MVFAEIEYACRYENVHSDLEALLRDSFSNVECGLQGDSWFWIFNDGTKVSVDTFSSMKHQVKSDRSGRHVQQVIDALRRDYIVKVYDEPEVEPHEER